MIREARMEDLPALESLYAHARAFMKEHGNPNQWGDYRPSREQLIKDIREGVGRVILSENTGRPGINDNKTGISHDMLLPEDTGCAGNTIAGAFAVFTEPDPTYAIIKDGTWLSDAPYCTIHRIAGDAIHKGTLEQATAYAWSICPHIRIDTHRDNKPMQGALLKNGYVHTGSIFLENGDERVAFERI